MKIEVVPAFRDFRGAGSDSAVVAVDVFRASTTIVTALANGARFVLPAADVEQALKLIEPYAANEALLGGERDCQKIEGFRLGNSPREYARETVAGKVVIFTTTNGTNALLAARDAGAVLIGCFLNFSAVARTAAEWPAVTILCAGNDGQLSLEDFICAGGLVARLAKKTSALGDAALAARAAYRQVKDNLPQVLLASEHAQRLADLGFKPDLDLALRLDAVPTVPRFADGRVQVSPV
jgi:2-phosphosulfolactate phosphatase